MARGRTLLLTLALAALTLTALARLGSDAESSATPQETPARPIVVAGRPTAPRTTQALPNPKDMIEGGLRHLAAAQNADGSFGGEESKSIRIGLSSIATLAYLAHGDTEKRGRYHDVVAKGIRFLMSCSIREGKLSGYFQTTGDTTSRMHGHGYATLALTQAYGMFGARRKYANSAAELRDIIHDAVDVIIRSQTKQGGWNYDPFERDDDEGSITVCMLQALRGARNCGFHVPLEVIEKAREYLRNSQNEDGSFRYKLFGASDSTFELTAAACASLIHAGDYYDRAVRNGRDFLWNQRFDEMISGARGRPYYGFYYAVQVLWFDFDRDRLKTFYPQIVSWYRRYYDPTSGSYQHAMGPRHEETDYGLAYRAAFATLTLQIVQGQLPVFHR